MALTQAQLDLFWSQGFLHVTGVIRDQQLHVLQDEFDRVTSDVCEQYQREASSLGTDDDHVIYMYNLWQHSKAIMATLYAPEVLDIVQDLIGPSISLFHDQAFIKPAGTGTAIGWHQDNIYWGAKPSFVTNCWVALDDVAREKGALKYIPGSHLAMWAHDRTEDGERFYLRDEVDEANAVTIEMKAGDCVFHHGQVIHGSHPNVTSMPRRAYTINYMATGTKFDVATVDACPSPEHPVLRRA